MGEYAGVSEDRSEIAKKTGDESSEEIAIRSRLENRKWVLRQELHAMLIARSRLEFGA
jgi:hypothetical protein